MRRNFNAFVCGLLVTVAGLGYASTIQPKYSSAECMSPPLETEDARNRARQDGYAIHEKYGCISRKLHVVVEANPSQAASQVSELEITTLAQARDGFNTKLFVHAKKTMPVGSPTPKEFVSSLYSSGGRMLPTFVTPDPQDGFKHPAIIWLPDAESPSGEEFWNSATASAIESFRAAGIVVMIPGLRGATADSKGELFLGEVDDVIAAAEHLARLGYIDADRIYLGGDGTGGTLALLTAETSAKFPRVFAFGPAAEVSRYAPAIPEVDFQKHAAQELKLRSPVHWLHGIETPTYVIEGRASSVERKEVETLCARSKNPNMQCVWVGSDHESAVSKVSGAIAARLLVSDQVVFSLRSDEFTELHAASL